MKSRISNVVLAFAAVALACAPVAGQTVGSTPKTGSKIWTPPKTPWGDPDLQGVWPGTAMNGVPLQRRQDMGTRALLNDQEYTQRVAGFEATAEADNEEFVSAKTKCDPSKGGLGETPETCGVGGVRIGPPRYWDERGQPNRQASLVVDPPDGRIPALTAEAQKAAAARVVARSARPCSRVAGGCHDTWEDDSLYDRCITRGLLGSILPGGYDGGNQIVQGPGYVVIRNEMIHEARVVPLDGRPHLPSGLGALMGDSRGHWEGNTLVVETTGFSGSVPVGGTPASDALRIVERFTRTDADTLRYQATVDDPKTWTKPWSVDFPLKHDPKYQLYEYACHEGNYYMYNALTGARAQEKKAAAEAAKKIQQ